MDPFGGFSFNLATDLLPMPTAWLVDIWSSSPGFRFEAGNFPKGKHELRAYFGTLEPTFSPNRRK